MKVLFTITVDAYIVYVMDDGSLSEYLRFAEWKNCCTAFFACRHLCFPSGCGLAINVIKW